MDYLSGFLWGAGFISAVFLVGILWVYLPDIGAFLIDRVLKIVRGSMRGET